MRHSIKYKYLQFRKTIGFIKLNTRDYTLDLKILRTCLKYQPIVKEIHKRFLKILKEEYRLIEGGKNIHKYESIKSGKNIHKIKNLLELRVRGGKCERKKK